MKPSESEDFELYYWKNDGMQCYQPDIVVMYWVN